MARVSSLVTLLFLCSSCAVDHPMFSTGQDTGTDAAGLDMGTDTQSGEDVGVDVAYDGGRDVAVLDMFMCTAPQQACGEACVNVNLDDQHCGGCNQPCDAFAVCKDGQCLPLPLQVPTLRLWLDASNPSAGVGLPPAGPLAIWHDRSTAGNDAIGVGELPTAGQSDGRAYVRFENQRFEITAGILSESNEHIEVFVVMRSNAAQDGSLFEIAGSDRLEVQIPRDNHALRIDLPNRLEQTWGRDFRHVTLWHISSGMVAMSLAANGVPVARGPARGVIDASGSFALGARNGGSRDASFDLMELLVFERPLSADEREKLTEYLMTRWALRTSGLPSEGLIRHYDATDPSAAGAPASGDPLLIAQDLSASGDHATCTNVTWNENGLSTGHPSFHLETSSFMEFTNPHSGALTISVVFRTPTERGSREWWGCPTLLGGDGNRGDNDGALVLDDGHMRWRNLDQQNRRAGDSYSDDRPHHVVLTRLPSDADGTIVLRVWVDGVRVLDGVEDLMDLGLPEHWWVGAHQDSNGSLEGDFAEIHVYDRVLSDDELNQLEAYAQAKWDLPAIGDRRP